MNILYIGDPHIKPSNMKEARQLFTFIKEIILELKPDRVVLLGDLFHTHAVLRLEVLEFWDQWLNELSQICELVVLVGNHDMTGDYNSDSHALSVFKRLESKNLTIVDKPTLRGVHGYLPYIHDKERFIAMANGLASSAAKILVCHQSFSTSKFESGTYDPEGIDPSPINFDTIISGHIHANQECLADGKQIIHPGTAWWMTESDANQEKGIWLYEHDDSTGAIITKRMIGTKHVVTKIVSIKWEEGKPLPAIEADVKTTIELIGSAAWVANHKKELKGNYSLKTQITDRVDKSIRNPGKNFHDFVSNVFVTSVDRTALLKYMKEHSIV